MTPERAAKSLRKWANGIAAIRDYPQFASIAERISALNTAAAFIEARTPSILDGPSEHEELLAAHGVELRRGHLYKRDGTACVLCVSSLAPASPPASCPSCGSTKRERRDEVRSVEEAMFYTCTDAFHDAASPSRRVCQAQDGVYGCTEMLGHDGDHLARILTGEVVAQWAASPPSETTLTLSDELDAIVEAALHANSLVQRDAVAHRVIDFKVSLHALASPAGRPGE